MRGKKGTPQGKFDTATPADKNPADPPRRRANKKRGHGTMANDRPPIVATIGRTTGQVRLRVVDRTDKETRQNHVHR